MDMVKAKLAETMQDMDPSMMGKLENMDPDEREKMRRVGAKILQNWFENADWEKMTNPRLRLEGDEYVSAPRPRSTLC
jgi:hypothetical protein